MKTLILLIGISSLLIPVGKLQAAPALKVSGPVQTVAGNRPRRRRHGRRRKMRHRRYRRRRPALESIQGAAGIVSGGDNAFVIEGEYQLPLIKVFHHVPRAVSFAIGGGFWRNSGVNVISVESGGDFSWWANPQTRFYGGARLAYTDFSATGASTSSFYLMPVGGFDYRLSGKGGFVGAQMKFPLTKKIDGAYILAIYRFEFDWDKE